MFVAVTFLSECSKKEINIYKIFIWIPKVYEYLPGIFESEINKDNVVNFRMICAPVPTLAGVLLAPIINGH